MTLFEKFVDDRDSAMITEKRVDSDESPWLMRTGWREHMEGLDLEILQKMTEMLEYDSEPEMYALVGGIDSMFNGCENFLRKTRAFTRRWMRSISSTDPPHTYPFGFRKRVTMTRYCRVWKKVLLYLLRGAHEGVTCDGLASLFIIQYTLAVARNI